MLPDRPSGLTGEVDAVVALPLKVGYSAAQATDYVNDDENYPMPVTFVHIALNCLAGLCKSGANSGGTRSEC